VVTDWNPPVGRTSPFPLPNAPVATMGRLPCTAACAVRHLEAAEAADEGVGAVLLEVGVSTTMACPLAGPLFASDLVRVNRFTHLNLSATLGGVGHLAHVNLPSRLAA